jgi:hypothetical protein
MCSRVNSPDRCCDAADELWDMDTEPKPRRSAARRSDNAAIAGGGSRGAKPDRSAAADVAAAPLVPAPSRGAGNPATGSGSGGGSGGARPGKRKPAEVQNPQERLAKQLRGHGRTAASNGNGASNGLHAPAATTLASEEVGARALLTLNMLQGNSQHTAGSQMSLSVSADQPSCAYQLALIIDCFIHPQDAQPNLANAPPAGPHEPLRLRGDSSGNYLQPGDEAATTDEEVLLLLLLLSISHCYYSPRR